MFLAQFEMVNVVCGCVYFCKLYTILLYSVAAVFGYLAGSEGVSK